MSLAGKFLLPYGPGQVFEIDKERGQEIIDSGYGELAVDDVNAVQTNNPDKESAAAHLKVAGAETVKGAENAADKGAAKAEKA